MSITPEIDGLHPGEWQVRLAHFVETMRQTSMHTDPSDMVRVYTARMRNWVQYDRMLSLTRRGVEAPTVIVARDSERTHFIDPWAERQKLPRISNGLLSRLVYSNEAQIISDIQLEPGDPSAPFIGDLRSLIAVPVFDGGEALNMVVFLRREVGGFDPQMLPQTVWTANLFGRATHSLVLSKQLGEANAQLMQEMKVIAELQRSLLPEKLPEIAGVDLAAYYQPATQAGGDYYDFFPLPGDRWGILVADVSGHGSPAAVLMAITHTLAHTQPVPPTSPGRMLQYVNHHLAARYTGDRGVFVTAFFGVYDPATRSMTYASAGHPPPRVKRWSTGEVFHFNKATGLPLGIVDDEQYEEATIHFQHADQIVFYTDGITESFSPSGEMFGVERLDAALKCCLNADGLISAVLGDLNTFTGGREAMDDRTLVIARID
jgi:sigma-B regulation protein RsbU (phosphoserine phosphatase)